MTHPSGNTAFETSPVESLFDAINNFAAAFDIFQDELSRDPEHKEFLENVKVALYKPVYPKIDSSGPISLFEIGVMYMPSGKNAGTYTVCSEKLAIALQNRENEVKALFVQQDGLISDVAELVTVFLEGELREEVYAKAKGFLNECYRLEAMF